MTSTNSSVIKLGGSLLSVPGLAARWRKWIDKQGDAPYVVIAGGGSWGDAARQVAETQSLSATDGHWLAIDSMRVTAKLVAKMLGLPLVSTWHERFGDKHVVLDVADWLRSREPHLRGPALPHGWHVTSDSIAARVARTANARELVLIKSRLPDANACIPQMAHDKYVDDYFPTVAASLRLRFVDFRRDDLPERLSDPGNSVSHTAG